VVKLANQVNLGDAEMPWVPKRTAENLDPPDRGPDGDGVASWPAWIGG
jgi:hypothetical protein